MDLVPPPVYPEGAAGMPVVYDSYSDENMGVGEFTRAVMEDPPYSGTLYTGIGGSDELRFDVGMSSSLPSPILYPQPFYQRPGGVYGSTATMAVKPSMMMVANGALRRDSLMDGSTPMISGRLGAPPFSHLSSSASSSRSGSLYAAPAAAAVSAPLGMGSIAPSLLSTPSPPPLTPSSTTATTATSASVSTNTASSSSGGRVRVSGGRRNALHHFSPYPVQALSPKNNNRKYLDSLEAEKSLFDYEDNKNDENEGAGAGGEAVTPLPLHYSPYAQPALDVVSDRDLQTVNSHARSRQSGGVRSNSSASSCGAEGSSLRAFLSAGAPASDDQQSFASNEMSLSSSSSSSSSSRGASPLSCVGSPFLSRTHTPAPQHSRHGSGNQNDGEFVSSLALDFSPSSTPLSSGSLSSSSASEASMMSFFQAPLIDVSYYA